MEWRPAVLLSGILECAIALVALVYWYSYSVTHWAADAVFSAIQNGAEIDPNAIGFAGLAVMFLHPLTWVIVYCGVEGMVSLCAAFTDITLAVLPLFLFQIALRSRKSAADRILFALACDGASARRYESLREVCEWLRPS
jgi:hypothetical protein